MYCNSSSGGQTACDPDPSGLVMNGAGSKAALLEPSANMVADDALGTHLYYHPQVSDIHSLRLYDLHDDTVQVGQLWVGCHAANDEG